MISRRVEHTDDGRPITHREARSLVDACDTGSTQVGSIDQTPNIESTQNGNDADIDLPSGFK